MSSGVKMMEAEVHTYNFPSNHESGRRGNDGSSVQKIQPVIPELTSVSTASSEPLDLICIGFGPASLAIAIALHDLTSPIHPKPKVAFLERQSEFAWHSGMQLPGARMQISFLKDLATPRSPRSKFTFINYLFSKNRLNTFINLSTFLPSRAEYEDYLRWCAGHFEGDGIVSYGQDVLSVAPETRSKDGKVTAFKVVARDTSTGKLTSQVAHHVVVALGGQPIIPAEFPAKHPLVIHSSSYSQHQSVGTALSNPTAPYHIAVVGSGQSAAEIFNDLPSRYPNAKISLIIKGAALRPSDDSPFVNEIFDPDRVDGIYSQTPDVRTAALDLDRGTNYGVVRLNLLEHLYEKLYAQRLQVEKGKDWKIRIVKNRKVVATEDVSGKLLLKLEEVVPEGASREELAVDAVFVATGYTRTAHEGMLKETRELLPSVFRTEGSKFPVRRDYKVAFEEGKVAEGAGVWLQGCNEKTHGLSDTLLSILAVRGGEMVQSIFGSEMGARSVMAKL